MKKNLKKFLLSTTAVLLVMALSVAGTLAYLQASSGDVVNTFNTNKVMVDLEEKNIPEGGFSIIPGTAQSKDATVKVNATVDAYVYLVITDTSNGAITYDPADCWEPLKDGDTVIPNVYVAEVTGDAAEQKLPVLKSDAAGNEVFYPASLTNETMPTGDVTLSFKAYAIQKINGTNADGVNTEFTALQGYSQAVLGVSSVTAPADATSLETVLQKTQAAETAGDPVAVVLTDDVSGITGFKVGGNNLTPTFKADFRGNTATVSQPVGSTGTVHNGMQLLKGSTVELVNGTYNADNSTAVWLLVQNYSDLTLRDFNLDATGKEDLWYVLSSNNGNVLITGNSNITAIEGGTAIDVMYWPENGYRDGTIVTIDENMTGVVDGKLAVYPASDESYVGNGNYIAPGEEVGAQLIIKGGTFKNTGLTLEQFKLHVAAGYKVIENADGSWTVTKA